jgi:predicted phosphodiesterase
MIDFPTDVTRFAVAGDWHANMGWATHATSYAGHEKAQVLLHVGDFGYKFNTNYLNALQNEAQQQNLIIMFVDGNHEDFDWLNAQPIDEDGVRRLRERVWHLPRGFRWEWLGTSFLALGGAHSVDRQWRNAGSEWWPQERITFGEAYSICQAGHADVMITHDCPNGVVVPGLMPDGTFPAVDISAAKRGS